MLQVMSLGHVCGPIPMGEIIGGQNKKLSPYQISEQCPSLDMLLGSIHQIHIFKKFCLQLFNNILEVRTYNYEQNFCMKYLAFFPFTL